MLLISSTFSNKTFHFFNAIIIMLSATTTTDTIRIKRMSFWSRDVYSIRIKFGPPDDVFDTIFGHDVEKSDACVPVSLTPTTLSIYLSGPAAARRLKSVVVDVSESIGRASPPSSGHNSTDKIK